MLLSTANSEYTVQEENLLSSLDTGEEKRTKFTSTEELSSSGSYDNSSLLPSHIYLYPFLSSNFYCWLSCGIFQCWLLPTLGGKPVTLKKITKPTYYQQG